MQWYAPTYSSYRALLLLSALEPSPEPTSELLIAACVGGEQLVHSLERFTSAKRRLFYEHVHLLLHVNYSL
jgi:hypothetical protein